MKINKELEKYLHNLPKNAFWIDKRGEKRCQSVHGNSYVRYNDALQQSKKPLVDKNIIITLILTYLSEIGIQTTDNPEFDPKSIDYDNIKERFELNSKDDLLWLKFTKDGYLGVVAVSADINFDMPKDSKEYDTTHKVYDPYKKIYKIEWLHNSSGIIIHKLGKRWDETFVLIFPLKNIPLGYTKNEVENAVGNMLISKDVPILDSFSHIY